MSESVTGQDLLNWAETLAGIARTGLGFTESLYEKERYEEILKVASKWSQYGLLGKNRSKIDDF